MDLLGKIEAKAEKIASSHGTAAWLRPSFRRETPRLVNTACLRFCHTRLTVEYEQESDPTLNQMFGFCLAAKQLYCIKQPHQCLWSRSNNILSNSSNAVGERQACRKCPVSRPQSFLSLQASQSTREAMQQFPWKRS
jgi:hypothetical protein